MKTLCVFIFTAFLALAVAEDSHQSNSKEVKKSAKVSKSTKAYSEAKAQCLKNGEELKGKKLKDCIVEYQKEAK